MLIKEKSKNYLKIIKIKTKTYEYSNLNQKRTSAEDKSNDLIFISIAIIGSMSDEIWAINEGPIIISENEKLKNKQEDLYFVSRFFDLYFQSNLSLDLNKYYILMGAVAYYFCDMIGSSKVMIATFFNDDCTNFDFNASGLEKVIIWLLDNDKDFNIKNIDKNFRPYIEYIKNIYNDHFTKYIEISFEKINQFKNYVYKIGSPRELLFTDIILAIFKKKIYNSSINLMPIYSKLEKKYWIDTFKNNLKMVEMWPSQILLGEYGIFEGKSGVIQMPTSSGKTTSVALAIQSSFLSNRTMLAVIVAPYRALCKEIAMELNKFFQFDKNIIITEFSDIPEESEINNINKNILLSISKKIIVMTPEKLIYISKHNANIIENINMIVFDESHLIDDSSRGTNYELLLTVINKKLKKNSQKILVSAVISNAEELNTWINSDGIIIKNNSIKTSEKSFILNDIKAKKNVNDLNFVNPYDGFKKEFTIEREVNKQVFKNNKNKEIDSFPNDNKSWDFEIYNSLTLIDKGSVAIFCAQKNFILTILKRFIELEKRGISLKKILNKSDSEEINKIANLIKQHMGENDLYYATLKGIVGHHANIPNGIKISIEFALKKGFIKCVVYTTTLSQGVNLPIKYLIVSSIQQTDKIIKVRDFQNLIGRTGRAGIETEGTIILILRDKSNSEWKKNNKLKNYENLLNFNNVEKCTSNLLKLTKNIELTKNNLTYDELEKIIVDRYLYKVKDFEIDVILNQLEKEPNEKNEKELKQKMDDIKNILISLENFIMSFANGIDDSLEMIKSTYGYFLANLEEKKRLIYIHNLIKKNINSIDINKKTFYNKTMLGITKMEQIVKFVDENFLKITEADDDGLVAIISKQLLKLKNCKIISKINKGDYVPKLLKLWLEGTSYIDILNHVDMTELKINLKTPKLEQIINLCINDFGYLSLNLIQSIIEILEAKNSNETIVKLNNIICRIRYGLPTLESVYVYELGFSDRIISQKIANKIKKFHYSNKIEAKKVIKKNIELIKPVLSEYPYYFINILENI